MEVAMVFIILFVIVFGIFYLFYSTRNKERLALIEKGADASIFMSGKIRKTAPFWKVLILNLSVLLIGVGLGIFIAAILHANIGIDEEIAYPGTIFLMAGMGLFVGFNLTKKLDKE